MPDKYKQLLIFVIIFLIFVPFIFIWQPYPFLRAGMFATPVSTGSTKEFFFIIFEGEKAGKLNAEKLIPFNTQKINYISRSFVYKNRSKELLKNLIDATEIKAYDKAHLYKVNIDQSVDTILVATYEK